MLRRWPAAATFVALVLACASPTLPLPPPEAPSEQVVDAQHVRLAAGCGGAEPNAQILADNVSHTDPSTGFPIVGLFASDCGSWQMDSVFALTGDVLLITQQFGNSVSPATRVCVPDGICQAP